MTETSRTHLFPVLPLRNAVVFPVVPVAATVGRPASTAAVHAALASEEKLIAVFLQKDPAVQEPQVEDLHTIGTAAVIQRTSNNENAMDCILVGVKRIKLVASEQVSPYMKARIRWLPIEKEEGPEIEALQAELLQQASKLLEVGYPGANLVFSPLFSQVDDPMHLVYLLARILPLKSDKAQRLLEAGTQSEAMRTVLHYLTHEIEVAKLRKKIASDTEVELNREQREYILRQQMQAIRQELGEKSPAESEIAELQNRVVETHLPEGVRKEVESELSRLEKTPSASPDYQVMRAHLELILELPWDEPEPAAIDLTRAREVLDEDHYGLKEVKERIIEQLAVLKLNPEAKGPILCFAGPPGVGKTSLGQSIARALDRKFEHFSLGGLHDEAELRGHRRTYIGAMPGRIIQAIRRAGRKDPLIMLDEVDKLGRDFRGDPASALMEILDPAQNNTFRDNYLDLPYDLSRVLFILTANMVDTIPRPLLDRMEVLRLSGYSVEEKVRIAQLYLIHRQRKEAGLAKEQLSVPEETIQAMIQRYTREAGVRELERLLGRLARKAAVHFAMNYASPITVFPADLAEMLGPERFFMEKARKELAPGVAAGLAWTEAGGEVLYIEAIGLPAGEFTLTGQLGDVMKESAKAANSYIVSKGEKLGICCPTAAVHVHVPAGATPKDGPSAGVAMAVALASLYSSLPTRSDTAMTGEITLSGLVLPVGGIKEKVLAARRSGIHRVILPEENRKDLREIPEQVAAEMEFIFAEHIEDVLRAAIPGLTYPADRRMSWVDHADHSQTDHRVS